MSKFVIIKDILLQLCAISVENGISSATAIKKRNLFVNQAYDLHSLGRETWNFDRLISLSQDYNNYPRTLPGLLGIIAVRLVIEFLIRNWCWRRRGTLTALGLIA